MNADNKSIYSFKMSRNDIDYFRELFKFNGKLIANSEDYKNLVFQDHHLIKKYQICCSNKLFSKGNI